uniref:UDP-xylose and UDP-N-acetylglucosamine transporter n=1 Tax=Romanomermis culicivorax TaxID=13658 RepID=A0A915JKF7_ROMCU
MDIPLAISSVLGSCCGCMIFVEYLAKEDPGSMNLMTFSSFLFISLEGLILYNKFGTVKNNIPLRSYVELVVIFFMVSVINNQALNFHIPVPLHIIFRSGSLISNMLMGMWLLKKRYSLSKYVSVIFVTAGIIVCTLATSFSGNSTRRNSQDPEKGADYLSWIIGVSMLWFALFFSSLLGIRQEQLFTKYGKHSREALFFIHALSLPGFVLFSADIYNHIQIFSASSK